MKTLILIHMALCLYMGFAKSLSKEEYLEMKRHLRTLNKPAVKSLQTSYNGDIFDCVEIYKQPAFDHPLLKNYKIPEVPKLSFPDVHDDVLNISSNDQIILVDFELPDGGCPDGTVPIRRVQMQDLLRAPSLSAFGKKYPIDASSLNITFKALSGNKYHWARIETKSGGDFHGTYVDINIWKPKVTGKDKYSSTQFWLVNGPADQFNVIQAGWLVSGELYGDLEPRFFIYWTSDSYKKTGCYNTLCPGFISLNPRAPLGTKFNQISTPGGPQYFMRFLVAQQGQDWWLYANYKVIGFWPGKLFNHMKQKAEKLMWGGEVFSTSGGANFPPMGSGFHSRNEWKKACFMKNIGVFNGRHEPGEAPLDTVTYVDNKCYSVTDKGVDGDTRWRRYFYFGGPGGTSCANL